MSQERIADAAKEAAAAAGTIVRAGGTTGTSNLTDNTPAAGGLILR